MAAEQKEEEEETSGGIYWKKTGYNMKLSNVSQTVTYEKENLSFRQFASANVSIPFGGSLTWEVAVQKGEGEKGENFSMGVVDEQGRGSCYLKVIEAKEKIQMTISRNEKEIAISFYVDGGPLVIPADEEKFKSFLKEHDSEKLYPAVGLNPLQSTTISLQFDSFVKPAKR